MALDDLAAACHGRRAGERAQLVDVGALLDDGAEAWRPLARAFGAELAVEPLRGRALVHADPVRLAQACGNLVANAVEHGASPVRVRGRVLAGRVRVEVHDAGPGLPGPVRELIGVYGRPRRGPGGSRWRAPLAPDAPRGRGLAIAAGIAERHGGRLAAAPSADGACLVLELPCADGSLPLRR
jgi:signal transduction histidine kinase